MYRVVDKEAGPKLEARKGRAKPDGPLVDGETLTLRRRTAAVMPGAGRLGHHCLPSRVAGTGRPLRWPQKSQGLAENLSLGQKPHP
ncbi:hypothetical protein GCM10027038_22240 [Arthrobacter bambusae]